MRNQDWYDLGDKVQKIVQDAVNSRDFRQLNENITRTVDRAVRDGGDVLKNVFGRTGIRCREPDGRARGDRSTGTGGNPWETSGENTEENTKSRVFTGRRPRPARSGCSIPEPAGPEPRESWKSVRESGCWAWELRCWPDFWRWCWGEAPPSREPPCWPYSCFSSAEEADLS